MTTSPGRLVVLGSSLTALAVVRAAHRSGFECIMLDDRRGPGSSTRMARFRLLEGQTEDTWLDQIRAHFKAGSSLIVDSDRWLRFLVRYGDAISDHGYRVLHPSRSAIETCLDKTRFLRWCAEQDLPTPRLYERSELASAEFPVLLRPQETQHSVATALPKAVEAKDRRELQGWLERFAAAAVEPNVCQSLLRPGLRQFSVGAARNSSGEIVTVLAEKVRPTAEQCAGGTYVRTICQSGIEQLAARVLERFEFFGVAEIEVLFDPATESMWIVEINARPWLQYGLPYACGVDMLAHVVNAIHEAPSSVRRSHAWLYFHSDLYACFSQSSGTVRDGNLSVWEYARSLLEADVYCVWDWADPWPLLRSVVRRLQ